MRLALADIKKSISHRNGETRLNPYLLRPGELAGEIAALIALYESWVGRERADFPVDRAAELIGDYRLARCLTNCLAEDYEWQSPAWPGPASEDEAAALAAREIHASAHLRLALYDWVNERAGGSLSAATRETALDACAASLGLRRATLDTLLVLDADAQAVLRRMGETPPTAATLARRYNQRVFESLLANSASVEWVVPAAIGQAAGEPLGTVIKRLCFLARTIGVHYDISFADEEPIRGIHATPTDTATEPTEPLARVAESPSPYALDDEAEAETEAETLEAAGRPVRILLYGPQEISAAPVAYGERLARLCSALLGYRRSPEPAGRRATLAGSGLHGVAQVYLHGRPLAFPLEERLLKLLGVAADAESLETPAASYDSALEARFAGEFAALDRADAAHGWRLEREPEPLLLGETILVPDFALIRGMRRVYLEIAGYWRPGYRERKARKLAALRGRVALVIAAPEAARSELGIFADSFPFLWYTRDHIRAHELVALLDSAYDDATRRLATLDLPKIRAEVALRGRVPVRESYALLHSYTRAELDGALASLVGAGDADAPVWVDGLGLCAAGWLDAVQERLRRWVGDAPDGRLPLATLTGSLRASDDLLVDVDETTAESLAQRAGLTVARTSIFAAEVIAPGAGSADMSESSASVESKAPASGRAANQPAQLLAQPRPRARRKQHRQQDENFSQLDFFTTESADDDRG